MIYKTCALCSNDIRQNDTICINCAKQYGNMIDETRKEKFTDTDWFKELKAIEHRQYMINRYESIPILYALNNDKEQLGVKKNIGRPTVDWRIANNVIEVFDTMVVNNDQLSLRKLARRLKYKVAVSVIHRILNKYRSEQYIKLMSRAKKTTTKHNVQKS